MTTKELGHLLGGISGSTIRRLVSRGTIPAIRVGRQLRFDPVDVIEHLRSRETGGDENGGRS